VHTQTIRPAAAAAAAAAARSVQLPRAALYQVCHVIKCCYCSACMLALAMEPAAWLPSCPIEVACKFSCVSATVTCSKGGLTQTYFHRPCCSCFSPLASRHCICYPCNTTCHRVAALPCVCVFVGACCGQFLRRRWWWVVLPHVLVLCGPIQYT
jgi:hypothetical protein